MDSIEDEVSHKVEEFNNIKRVNDRLRFLIDYSKNSEKKNFENFLELIPGKYKDYYTIVGPDIITSCSYAESEIKKKWQEVISNGEIQDDVTKEIYNNFFVGKRYTKSDIKEILKSLYQKLGYQKTAKATDLEVYFVMKPILTSDKKHGFEILGKR
jgi:hypothetical protein